MTDAKVRENRTRRAAERQGLRLVRSRRRDKRAADYGIYRVVDTDERTVFAGGIEQVELYIDMTPEQRHAARVERVEADNRPIPVLSARQVADRWQMSDADALRVLGWALLAPHSEMYVDAEGNYFWELGEIEQAERIEPLIAARDWDGIVQKSLAEDAAWYGADDPRAQADRPPRVKL